MVRPERRRRKDDSASSWWMPWPVVALVVVTVPNYVWQVVYYLHFYGRFGASPGGLTVPLLLTFLWFLVATVLLVTRRRGGVPVMASFLVVEALFYLVHNVSGAAGYAAGSNAASAPGAPTPASSPMTDVAKPLINVRSSKSGPSTLPQVGAGTTRPSWRTMAATHGYIPNTPVRRS